MRQNSPCDTTSPGIDCWRNPSATQIPLPNRPMQPPVAFESRNGTGGFLRETRPIGTQWTWVFFVMLWIAGHFGAIQASQLMVFTEFSRFEDSRAAVGGIRTITSPWFTNLTAWDELIVSWNIPNQAEVEIEARGGRDGISTRFYRLGHWSGEEGNPGTSPDSQEDENGRVATDTLVLKRKADAVQVRVRILRGETAPSLLAIALSSRGTPLKVEAPEPNAWGRRLAVPIRSQADYPEGITKWCSPVTTSMILEYWADQKNEPSWRTSVRKTVSGVYDPGWPGTGNWPFNMAYAGAHRGLHACVARLDSLRQLELLTAGGFPVGASVSYAKLKGRPKVEPGDGHLIVVCGFDESGNVVVNDPGSARERVRWTASRADFSRAWESSQRTVYLIWPETETLPILQP
jgi:Peptidase_C39 like family